jgi:FKBP-type peptidyl-prolyl cis-trans isomerase SlpA
MIESFPAAAADDRVVGPGAHLTLHYRLSDGDGRVLVETFGGRPATLELGRGQLAPGLEARLLGLRAGQQARFALAPGEAYGPRNDALLQRVSRALLAREGDPQEHYAVGDVVAFRAPDGASFAGVLRALDDDGVWFDFNHPLAGQALGFEVQIIGVLNHEPS